MKREDIENAAREESGRWAPTPIHIQDIYRRDDFEAGFHTGAEWRINIVWHNITEEPKPGSWIAILTCNVYIKSVYSYKDICRYMRVINAKGWAYIEDLIPNTEE